MRRSDRQSPALAPRDHGAGRYPSRLALRRRPVHLVGDRAAQALGVVRLIALNLEVRTGCTNAK